jgi:hypothetical protein
MSGRLNLNLMKRKNRQFKKITHKKSYSKYLYDRLSEIYDRLKFRAKTAQCFAEKLSVQKFKRIS